MTRTVSKDRTPSGLNGVNAPAAVAALLDRARRFRAGRREPDGRRLALVLEGGGMRAVCSAGGAVALARLGLTDAFDEVYATSAGAMNAGYFLAGQADLGITIYYQDLTDRRFINYLRPWKVLDVDYVFDHVVTVSKPLDVAAVMASRSRFSVALTDVTSGEGRVVDTRATRAPLLSVLKAATAIPVLYNRTVPVDGRPCMDGGLFNPFPLEHALADGCTDVLVLLTRPPGYRGGRPRPHEQWMFDRMCARGNEGVSRSFRLRHERDERLRSLAFGLAPAGRTVPAGVNIATLCIDAGDTIGRMTTDPAALRDAALRFGRRTLRAFGAEERVREFDLPPL